MPLDGLITDFVTTIPTRGSWDVSNKTPRQRLEMLRDFLRTPTPNVAWDFTTIEVNPECGTAGCAMGWYEHLTGKEYVGCTGSLMDEFQMGKSSTRRIFLFEGYDDSCIITPIDIADAIDRYLTGEEQTNAV